MLQRNSNNDATGNNSESVFSKPSLQSKKSFRLQNEPESIKNQSRYLMKYNFKQRIDSMFDETRSAILESNNAHQRKYTRACQSECGASSIFQRCNNILPYKYCEERFIKNTVQAQIEKMFADVNTSEIEDEGNSPNLQQFQVDYIGSLPLLGKVTSLQGLQEPLKDLYFNYRKNKLSSSKLQALLEISPHGLKIQNFQNGPRTIKEQLNPFPSIAVWAALKFVCRSQNKVNETHGLEYAFLPLIIDQKHSVKSSLFRSLDRNDVSCALEKTYDDHSPLFVVIMRQTGTSSHRLQCHGFACATSEDAIVLAANLYKALAATMNNSNNTNNGSFRRRKEIKCRDGLGTVCSIARSSVYEKQDYLYSQENDMSIPITKSEVVKKVPPPRPPRKNKIHSDKPFTNVHHEVPAEIIIESDEITVIEDINDDNEIIHTNDKDIVNRSFSTTKSGIKNSYSVHSLQSVISNKIESGDIFTKVVIPRSRSFLNASGPLNSRYNRCITNYMNEINLNNRKNSIHSPLGFIELFNELRIHEGLNNIDEILNMIIDVDGMSFNSLKPIYKEFIFKLAVTLTKDELYQRSKSIMQKQKHRKRQMMFNKRRFASGYRIKRVFHLSFSKLRPSKYKIGFPFASQLFPVFKKMQKSKHPFKPKMKLKRQNATSTLTSNDSFVIGFNRYKKNNFKYLSNDIYKDKFFYLKRGEISFHKKKLLSSDLSQTAAFSTENTSLLINDSNKIGNPCVHEIISNYISCSDCSNNSESCHYKTSKKCYCSLKKLTKRDQISRSQEDTTQQSSVSSCSCDTNSCIESEKCYCNHNKKPSIFEQLRQQGFAASESSLSRPSSPIASWQRNEKLTADVNRKKTCLQTSKSLEFFHINKNAITQPPSNHEENQLNFNRDYFQSDLENFSRLPNNAQNKKYSTKPLKTSRNTSDDNYQVYNSDNDDYSLNYCKNQLNYYSDNFIENENKNDDNLINSECFYLDNKYSTDYEHNKVLVVSTRDEKGQVKNSVAPLFNQSSIQTNDYIHENDAISVKKAAEIAALFSDIKDKKNNFNISNKVINNSMSPSKMESACIKKINLENSLGYFP